MFIFDRWIGYLSGDRPIVDIDFIHQAFPDASYQQIIQYEDLSEAMIGLANETLKKKYPWATVQDIDPLELNADLVLTHARRIGELQVRKHVPDATTDELETALYQSNLINGIDYLIYSRRRKHPNYKHCPDLFCCLSDNARFHMARSAPDDWKDIFGEPFQTRNRVYSFGHRSDPDGIRFYSSEELIASSLNPENRLFDVNEIKSLSQLAKAKKDHSLHSVIKHIKNYSWLNRAVVGRD